MLTFFCVISTPWNRIDPLVGVSSRFRLRRNVLLPEPEGPMAAMTSPCRISTEMPSSARMASFLNYLRSPRLILLSKYWMIFDVGNVRQKYTQAAMISGSPMENVADFTEFTADMISCTPMV